MIRLDAHRDEFHRDQQWHKPVRVATTADITIATALNAGDTLDGITLATGDRVLVKDQSAGAGNGIYIVGASPARAYDMLTGIQAMGAFVYVIAGTANGGKLFKNTNTTLPTIGSTALTFTEFASASTAASISVADSAGWFTGTNVETVLAELAAKAIGYQAHGAMGAAETFDAAIGWHSGTLDANCTFTLTGAPTGTVSSLFLELLQDGTGGRTITLPASVVNKADLEAAQDTTADVTTFLVLVSRDGGTTWFGGWWGSGGTFVASLGDLSDVALSTPQEGDDLRYVSGLWVNDSRKWEPVTNGEDVFVWDSDDLVMDWST